MLRKSLNLIGKFSVLVLPFLAGCSGGGGSSLGSLFSGSASEGLSSLFSGGGDAGALAVLGGSADAIATVHNPEPASMLLLGGGAVAMAYIKAKRKNPKN